MALPKTWIKQPDSFLESKYIKKDFTLATPRVDPSQYQSFPQQTTPLLWSKDKAQVEKTLNDTYNFAKGIADFIIDAYAPVIPRTIKNVKAGQNLLPAYVNAYKELNEEEQLGRRTSQANIHTS